jgi:hypothetical protein
MILCCTIDRLTASISLAFTPRPCILHVLATANAPTFCSSNLGRLCPVLTLRLGSLFVTVSPGWTHPLPQPRPAPNASTDAVIHQGRHSQQQALSQAHTPRIAASRVFDVVHRRPPSPLIPCPAPFYLLSSLSKPRLAGFVRNLIRPPYPPI